MIKSWMQKKIEDFKCRQNKSKTDKLAKQHQLFKDAYVNTMDIAFQKTVSVASIGCQWEGTYEAMYRTKSA